MVDMLAQAFDLECVAYFEVSKSGTARLACAAGNHHEEAVLEWAGDRGVMARAIRSARAVMVNDTRADPDYVACFPDTEAELTVPLLDGDRVVGLIDVQARQPGFFTPSALEVVGAIAAQAVIVGRSAELRRRHQQQLREQEAVQLASLDILAARPLSETLEYVTHQLRVLCRADEAGLYLLEPDGADLVLTTLVGARADVVGTHLAVGTGLAGRVAAKRHALVVADYKTWEHRAPQFDGRPWHAAAAAPLIHGDEVIGVIDVIAHDPGRVFGDEEIRILELLAAPAALAISNARRAEEHAADLATAVKVARALSDQTGPDGTRRAICEAAIGVSGCRSAALFELDANGTSLVSTANVNTTLPSISMRLDEPSVTATAFLRGERMFVSNVAGDPRVSRRWTELAKTHAMVAQPVFRNGVPIGVLNLFWGRAVEKLSERTLSVVGLLADDAAAAIERADMFVRLDELARCDPLTRMANRRSWDEELPRYLARASREGRPVSVAMLDLDHFKDFNDVQGHQRGDLLLREVAEAWRDELREGDLLARYGGEEFAVMLPSCPLEEAVQIVERLRGATPAGQKCSAGVACWDVAESADALVARADAALYEAKLTGRNRTAAALSELGPGEAEQFPGAALAEWTRWTGVVPRLLQEHSVRSAYQPVVRLADSALVGYEALARPVGEAADMGVEGLFAAAQYRGLGRDLDWLCRRAALTGSAQMPPGLSLFVNVGVSALLDPVHDVDQMLLVLEHAERRPQEVVLEITEREAVRDMGRFAEVLALYRECGFRFAIDDVGEGHSTLEVLATASPEFIKLARSLMMAALRPGPRSAIRAVVAFAESAGSQVIAEGIETAVEARRIHALGVELGQGHHLGRPQLAPAAFSTHLPRGTTPAPPRPA